GDPGRLPTRRRAVSFVQFLLGGRDLGGAHQVPVLLEMADEILALPVVPVQQLSQFIGYRNVEGVQRVEISRAGARLQALQVRRSMLTEPMLQAFKNLREVLAGGGFLRRGRLSPRMRRGLRFLRRRHWL